MAKRFHPYKLLLFFMVIVLVSAACDLPFEVNLSPPEQDSAPAAAEGEGESAAGATETSAPATTEASTTVPRFEPAECFFPTSTPQIECGNLIVWQNRGTQDMLLSLAVVIIHGRSNVVAPDAVLYLPDGPGYGGIVDVEQRWLQTAFLSKRDVVLFDPRGVGFSSPSLDCPELEGVVGEDRDGAALLCSQRLQAEGLGLGLYDSGNSAADIADLRQVLGYEQFNLVAVGYGSRLALTVMRDHADIVRSAMFDSLFPIEVNALDEYAMNVMLVAERVFSDCANDRACSQSYPELQTDFYEAVSRLGDGAVVFDMVQPATGLVVRSELSGLDILDLTNEALSDKDLLPLVPRFWTLLAAEDYNAALATIGKALPADSAAAAPLPDFDDEEEFPEPEATDMFSVTETVTATEEVGATEEVPATAEVGDVQAQPAALAEAQPFSEGAYYSAICKEEAFFNALETAEALTEDYPRDVVRPLLDEVSLTLAICVDWGAGAAVVHENNPVQTSIPVLVLSGKYDPLTPPAWAQAALPNFQQHFFFQFPGYGHALTNEDGCAFEIMGEFIDLPRTEPRAECLRGMPPFSFVPDENIELDVGVPPEELEEGTPEPEFED
ncbi:MAG: alpha/beta fold hydrolase [Anaerolineales bacterium]|nr:alpha/beta fold hydrolase [Anaerolineales bacterium]